MTTEAGQRDADGSRAPASGLVGPYRLVEQLGEGGMGVVHLALDPHGRAVALKLLRAHVAHDSHARARLRREVDVLGRIQDRRVAAVIDADLDGDRPYLVTRYVPGPPLDQVVEEDGPIDGPELLRLGRGLAGALDAIHDADVIHRDLKPGNVLMLDGDPVLIDFGIAHVADDVRITLTGLVMGTPGYLSPEVVEGAPVTVATDWWGWAATLAFAARGAPPFGRGPMDVVLSRVSRGDADLSGVDPRLAPLLYAALSPDPARRPDADEVMDALERYAEGRPVTAALAVSSRHTQVLDHPGTVAWARPQVAPMGGPYEPAAPDDDDLLPWDDSGEPSDWEAAWEGGPGEPDPRIGRPNRTGTLLALMLALVAGFACLPVVGAAVALVLSWASRTADRSVTSLVLRRHAKGRRRSDMPFAVAASPWHVVVGALASVMGALLPVAVGACAVFSTALATVAVTGGSPQPQKSSALAVGAVIAAFVAWWGPGGSGLRRGTRSIVRGVSPGVRAPRVLTGLLLLLAMGLAAWAVQHGGAAQWWPARSPSGLLRIVGFGS
jgi:serine/threonine protein kinase